MMPRYVAEPRYPLLSVVLVLTRILGALLTVVGIFRLIDAIRSPIGSAVVRTNNPEVLFVTAVGFLVAAGTLFLFAGVATVLVDSEKHLRVMASIANAREMANAAAGDSRNEAPSSTMTAEVEADARKEGARARVHRDAGTVGDGSRER